MPQFVPLFFVFLLEAAVYLSLMFRVGERAISRGCFGWKRWRAVMSGGVQQQCNFVSYALCAMLQFWFTRAFHV